MWLPPVKLWRQVPRIGMLKCSRSTSCKYGFSSCLQGDAAQVTHPFVSGTVSVAQVGGLAGALVLPEAFHGVTNRADVVQEPILRENVRGALS